MSIQMFDDAGIDAVKGTEMMSILDLYPSDLSIPQRFNQFREVVQFMKNFSDYRYVLNKITRGKQVDKLQHAWSYSSLAKEKAEKQTQLKNLEQKINEMTKFGSDDMNLELRGVSDMYLATKKDLASLDSEMEIYEK